MANNLSQLDAQQVIRSQAVELESGQLAQRVSAVGGSLVPQQYDQISLTYVTVGNGIGEIETVEYRFEGNLVATLTLSYDGNDKLSDVIRS